MKKQSGDKSIIHSATTLTYLKGIEALHDPQGMLHFDVMIKTGAVNTGEIEWLKKQIPQWLSIIRNNSYLKIEDQVRINEPTRDTDTAAIILNASLPGGLFDWKLHKKTGEALLKQIKKIAAEDLLKNIPPNFDIDDPLFLSVKEDKYILHATVSNTEFTGHQLGNLKNAETINLLSAIATRFGGNFMRIEPISYGRCTVITFLWKNDTSKTIRSSFLKRLTDELQLNRIACMAFPMRLPL